VDDYFKTITNALVGAGIKGYGAIADRSKMPSNKRIFLDTFADDQTSPITEKHFNDAELKSIIDLIKAKHAANPSAAGGNIKYADYDNFVKPSELSIQNVNSGDRNPYENIRTTLGQFKYVVDPATGNVSVSDVYDFNKLKENRVSDMLNRGDYVMNHLNPYSIARVYAGETMPPGKGRSVALQIPGVFKK
jgi:hypothetical protein